MENILIPLLFVMIILVMVCILFFILWRLAVADSKDLKRLGKNNLAHYGIHQPDDFDK